MNKLRLCGGLWRNKSQNRKDKDGNPEEYFSGSIYFNHIKIRIMIWKNPDICEHKPAEWCIYKIVPASYDDPQNTFLKDR